MTWQTYVLDKPAELPKGPTDLSQILGQMRRVDPIFDAEGDGEYVTFGCLECREVVKARFGCTPRFYVAECACPAGRCFLNGRRHE